METTVKAAAEAIVEAFVENHWWTDTDTKIDGDRAVTQTWVTVNGTYHARVLVQTGSIYIDVFTGLPDYNGERVYHLHLDLTLDLDAELGATVVAVLAAHYDQKV